MNTRHPIASVPNAVTVIRILLIPLFVIFLQSESYLYALLVFSLAAISDGLDGFLARYLDQRTTLGTFLDPLADKLLILTAFVGTTILRRISPWLAAIVISRDLLIFLGATFFAVTRTRFEALPSPWGKATTALQMMTICLMLLSPMVPIANEIKTIFFFGTAIITIISGGHYIVVGLKIHRGTLIRPHG